MSTPAKDNLARIRDNQRRSRARRREYLQELEQRLRVYELQGIEASTEVQMAARRVAEENRQLRELLNRHGVDDNHIALYLQSGLVVSPGAGAVQQPFRSDPGSTVPALQHVMVPRPVAGLDPGLGAGGPSSLPGRSSREPSSASGSTATSSIWSPTQQQQQQQQQQQPAMSSYNRQHVNSVMGSHHTAFQPNASFGPGGRQDVFAESSSSMVSNPPAGRPPIELHYPLSAYQDPTGQQHYGHPGSGC
ncbi:hypothetical protein L249_4159 [Ophiocordyceps polyrhachis-furcata BCC 54312]|uniref:BZIP domain-containing protein n=1 Tax=Ophiocordyceps polyrhachis-furcata BCC 54312 TaxID=1330021 RepID=A0A367L5T3_9HYPO|nr:hypothetical protein L249_4159 [Ophiocordyceps polyrhachis-furcata BCC 54312]